ncbi:MAG: DUF937 domain-containing protein [Castellaniella sp.]|uniref:DUF937 domain-containing protein n=1 Tax=Castellaniella sp. TaxID=1955812 RepID=UPI002A35A95C|nr:DUF937 domain-containing protein [Castellaniella sp.]MDY0309086.1 DUF937 domain-containing protein [Castellaniella sp.]
MQITDILAMVNGLGPIARQLGITEAQATSGAQALLPAVLGGFQKQAQGAGGLDGLLAQLGGASLPASADDLGPGDATRGNDVLGQIFGSKDVSRTVAQHAASSSGLDPALLKKMLPLLATLVAGFMSRQSGAAGQASPASPMGGLLGGLLGGLGSQGGAAQSAGGGLLGTLNSLLDTNGDGNALDDILRMASKAGPR